MKFLHSNNLPVQFVSHFPPISMCAIWSSAFLADLPKHCSVWFGDFNTFKNSPHCTLGNVDIHSFQFILQYQYKSNLFRSAKRLFGQLTLIYYSYTCFLTCARTHRRPLTEVIQPETKATQLSPRLLKWQALDILFPKHSPHIRQGHGLMENYVSYCPGQCQCRATWPLTRSCGRCDRDIRNCPQLACTGTCHPL